MIRCIAVYQPHSAALHERREWIEGTTRDELFAAAQQKLDDPILALGLDYRLVWILAYYEDARLDGRYITVWSVYQSWRVDNPFSERSLEERWALDAPPRPRQRS
jgi:hypothetical protein